MYPQPFGLTRLLLASACLLLFTAVLSACAEDRPPTLEERAQSVDQRLICPYCPAETIDQAQVPQAREMRDFVREKLAEGWTEQQILDYFSAPERYGLRVLAEPPKSGATLTIWLLPPAGFLFAGVLLFFVLRSMRKGDPSTLEDLTTDGPPPDSNDMSKYLERVDAHISARTGSPPPSSPFPHDGGRLGWGCSPTARHSDEIEDNKAPQSEK